MVFSNIEFKNFHKKKKLFKVKKILNRIVVNYSKGNNLILLSLSKKYKYIFKFQNLKRYKKFKYFKIFGMGGSSLGAAPTFPYELRGLCSMMLKHLMHSCDW